MDASAELLGKLDEYMERRITLEDLESWLAPRSFFYLSAPDSLAGKVAGAIELCLAEISAGIRTERSAKRSLAAYLKSVAIEPQTSSDVKPQEAVAKT